MPYNNDWLPRRNHDVLEMAKTWAGVLPANMAAWGVPIAEITELNALVFNAEDAVRVAEEAGGGLVADAGVRDAFRLLRPFMRVMKRRHFTSPPLTNLGFALLDLKPHDDKPTTEPAPANVPFIEVRLAAHRVLAFRLRDYGAKRWAKPAHVHGIHFRWEIRDSKPESAEALANVVVTSSSPIVLTFNESQRGLRVYFAACWLGSTLSGGPWSEIGFTIIP